MSDAFGPSLRSIEETLTLQNDWLDRQVWEYTDFDGTRKDVPMTDEQIAVLRRFRQLEELMSLRQPVWANEDWGSMMYFRICPCPGVPREVWARNG